MLNSLDLSPALPWGLLTLVSTGALLLAEHRDHAGARVVFKTAAATGFVGLALVQGAIETAFGAWLTMGLVLSMFGDLALLARGAGRAFLTGIGAFLLAHVAYLGAFFSVGIHPAWALAGLVVFSPIGVVLYRWLSKDVPSTLKLPVLAYILVITLMVAGALGVWGTQPDLTLLPPTAALFMISDIGVAMQRFKGAGFSTKLWATPAYFIAQFLFAIHAMLVL
jgi:uncharacterized membrane protein YhhN